MPKETSPAVPPKSKAPHTEMKDFRKDTIRNVIKSFIVGVGIATAGAGLTAKEISDLIELAVSYTDVGSPEQRKVKLEQLRKEINKVEKDIKEKGKIRERFSRLSQAFRNNQFMEKTIPYMKMQKNFYEASEATKDIIYWSTFVSWWFTFFGLTFGFMFKYLQSVILKKSQIETNLKVGDMHEQFINMCADIEKLKEGSGYSSEEIAHLKEVRDFMVLLRERQNRLEELFNNLPQTGELTPEAVTMLENEKKELSEIGEFMAESGVSVEIINDKMLSLDEAITAARNALKKTTE